MVHIKKKKILKEKANPDSHLILFFSFYPITFFFFFSFPVFFPSGKVSCIRVEIFIYFVYYCIISTKQCLAHRRTSVERISELVIINCQLTCCLDLAGSFLAVRCGVSKCLTSHFNSNLEKGPDLQFSFYLKQLMVLV